MIVTVEKISFWSDDVVGFVLPPTTNIVEADYEVREYPTASRAYCETENLRSIGLGDDGGLEVCYYKSREHYEACCAEWGVSPYDDCEVVYYA